MKFVRLTEDEQNQQRLTSRHSAHALDAMQSDGIVCLKQAIPVELVTLLNQKMQADLEVRLPTRTGNAWNSLRPPPFHPYLYPQIVYNEFAIDVCISLLGDSATLTTYGANTSWPGQETAQQIHRDVMDAPIASGCPAVVINIPLTDFTIENGATLIYPGSHLAAVDEAGGTRKFSETMLQAQAARRPSEQTVDVCRGDLVVRDLRLWHGGMPNRSTERRIMLALVVIDPDYRLEDESGFKGFEAEQGSEDFWQHARLDTSVYFVPPGDRTYYMHSHHSTPPTSLQLDWHNRQASQAK